jgi:PAS domain S-box-containing protein/diguanylate cyclase (GGDEF)-like protein
MSLPQHDNALLRDRMLARASNGIAVLDMEGVFTFVNARACEMTGYEADELIGASFTMLLSSEDKNAVSAVMQRTLASGEPVGSLPATLLRKDGTVCEVMFGLERLTSPEGEVIGIIGSAEDVTERKRIERLLLGQQELLQHIARSNDLEATMDRIARMTAAHTSMACRILGAGDSGAVLHVVATAGVPNLGDLSNHVPVNATAGAEGAAAYRRATVLTRDIASDPLWHDDAGRMRSRGLCSAWATPVLADDGVILGVIALYGTQPGLPENWHQQCIKVSCDLLRLAFSNAHAAESLVAQEERYRRLWNTSADAIVIIDLHSRIVAASPAIETIFGYTEDEVLGQNLAMLQPEPLRRQHDEAFRRHVETGAHRIDWRMARLTGLHRSGREFPIEVSLSDASHAGTRLFAGFIRDITARVQAEDSLRESEGRYRALTENAFDLVCELGADGSFVYVSPNFRNLLGYAQADLIGQSPWPLIHEDDRERVAQQFAELLGPEGEPGNTDLRFKHADGTWLWVEVSGNLYETPDGARHVVIVARDMSQRLEMSKALLESEQRLRTFIENAAVLMFATDRDGVYTLAEGKGLGDQSIDSASFVGRTVAEVHADNPDVMRNLERVLAGETFTDTVPFAGATFDAHHTPVRDEQGTVTGMVGVFIDVTDRMRAESLVAAQRQWLEMIALGSTLEEIFNELVRAVESSAPGTLCSILQVSSDGTRLNHAAAPSLPEAYNREVDGLEIGPGAGSCGTAAYRNEVVIVTDIEHDPLWEGFRDIALSHGLRACWSTPITSASGTVLGTLAMYYRHPHEPLAFEDELVTVAAHVAGIAIERRRSEQALRSRTAELERMYKRLVRTHGDLEDSKQRLEEKSRLLELALDTERERARRDQLTGALNHAAITDHLREIVEFQAEHPHVVAMVDVDGLKIANDTYGHQIGDMVLVKVAQILARPGVTVGRYGGDEFVVIMPDADRVAGEQYRDQVLNGLQSAGLTDPMTGARVPVVASIGLAVYPDEAETVEDLIRLSDGAMYQSRRQRAEGGETALARPLGGDRAARMVGELVPLLTSPGKLQDKLRLVAHRLSVGAGYDAVNFVLSDDEQAGMASSSFARVPEDFIDTWNARARSKVNTEIAAIVSRTRRPLIMDDLELDDHLDDEERSMLIDVGLRSALVAPMIWENNLIGVLTVASTRTGAFSVRDAEFVAAVATQVTAIVRMSTLLEQLRHSSNRLREAHEGTVVMLASAAEAHDQTTGGHLHRVRAISEAIAVELGYDDDAARALGLAATLHDIGKIRVPDSVLGSAQSLAEAEWVLMKQHTIWGGAFLAGQPGFELASTVARCHHERWDGTGYPDGLSGNQIPEGALITTVADSLDAMTSNRPYRQGRPLDEAVAEIVRCSGTQFSPRIVDALARLHERDALSFIKPAVRDDELAA